jgi:hypothetical protein
VEVVVAVTVETVVDVDAGMVTMFVVDVGVAVVAVVGVATVAVVAAVVVDEEQDANTRDVTIRKDSTIHIIPFFIQISFYFAF